MSVFATTLEEHPATSPSSKSYFAHSHTAVQPRKSDRACDFCRRRKTKCDGNRGLKDRCSNCIQNRRSCTYLETSKPREPSKAYVTALEDRVERFELLLKRLRPETDFSDEIGPPIIRGLWRMGGLDNHLQSSPPNASSSRKQDFSPASNTDALHPTLRKTEPAFSDHDYTFSSDEELGQVASSFRRLTIRPTLPPTADRMTGPDWHRRLSHPDVEEGVSMRFHGKSSFLSLLRTTRNLKRAWTGRNIHENAGMESHFASHQIDTIGFPPGRREEFWSMPPWELAWDSSQSTASSMYNLSGGSYSKSEFEARAAQTHRMHTFPPSDLTHSLLGLYFTHTNTQFPLLHKPTFYHHFDNRLHLRNGQFAGVVWCMMSVAARWSEDRRVLWTGWRTEASEGEEQPETSEETGDEWLSAGWYFFLRGMECYSSSQSIINPPHLFDLQICSLAAMFLRGSTIHPAGWVFIGIGLRKAQDVGAHRRKVYGSKPSVEDELWKRAFWMLVAFDRIGSASLGRPCCIREEDFDLDMPLEVDDEYWEPLDHSQQPFTQPDGKPSLVAAFNSFLNITQIVAFAMRTIYCIDKSKVLPGLVGPEWQKRIVSELNTALNEWVDGIPEHLRWSPRMDHEIFSNQSATLYTTYYLCLILIYRPFISYPSLSGSRPRHSTGETHPSTGETKHFPFPSLAICTNAADSAVRILGVQMQKGLSNIPNMISVAHICAAILLMGAWDTWAKMDECDASSGGDLANKTRAYERIMADVEKCMGALQIAELRWAPAKAFLQSIRASIPGSNYNTEAIHDNKPSTMFWENQRYPTNFNHRPSESYHESNAMNPIDSELAAHFSAENNPMCDTNWQWFSSNPLHSQPAPSKPYTIHDPLSQSQWDGGKLSHVQSAVMTSASSPDLHHRYSQPLLYLSSPDDGRPRVSPSFLLSDVGSDFVTLPQTSHGERQPER